MSYRDSTCDREGNTRTCEGDEKTQNKHQAQNHGRWHGMQTDGPSLKQPSFEDKYIELNNFKREVTNIFMTSNYSLHDIEQMSVIKIWLVMKGLKFIKNLREADQKACRRVKAFQNIW